MREVAVNGFAPSRRSNPFLVFIAPALLAAAIGFILAFFGELSPSQYIPIMILIGFTGQRIIAVISRTDPDLFQPLNLIAAYYLLYFGLRAIYVFTYPTAKHIGYFFYDDYIPAALWCSFAGYLSALIGTACKLPRLISRRVTKFTAVLGQWPRRIPVVKLAFFLVIGILCWLYLFSVGAFVVGNTKESVLMNSQAPVSGIPTLFAALFDLGTAALGISILRADSRGKQPVTKVLLAISIIFLAFRAAYTGSKQTFLEPLGYALIYYHYLRRRFTIQRIVIICVPIVVVAFGAMNIYRFVVVKQSGGAPTSFSDLLDRLSAAADYFSSDRGEEGQLDTTSFEMLMERQFGVDSLALIIKYTPERRPWGLGQQYIEIPLQIFVPRQLWSDKPIVYATGDFERDYLGITQGAFSSIHLISDFYQNFHIAGIIVGMFLVGVTVQSLYLVCAPSPSRPGGVFFYSVTILGIIHAFEWDLVSICQYYVRYLALVLFVVWFLNMRLKSPVSTVEQRGTA